jgi:transposase InsO family protein
VDSTPPKQPSVSSCSPAGRSPSIYLTSSTPDDPHSYRERLKSEIGVREWATRALARSQVFRWIAGYYNRRRLHSTIDYLTPMQARVRYGQPVALAA